MKKFYGLIATFLVTSILWSQESQPPPTSFSERLENEAIWKNLQENSLVTEVPFVNIGPSVFSGRVVDIEVNPADPSIFYVAYASGGLWKTINNGTTFTPIFDNELVMTIGDIAVDWNQNTLWVGSGESNSSRSSYAGLGVYKSVDDGKSWQHSGLFDSHHIGRVILHPENPQIAWIAVVGHLYSQNQERGIYMTKDGGDTWTQVLFINENTGGIDLIRDTNDPDVLYAAMWERTRRAWDFVEAGSGSGIYKSSDGGLTWKKLNIEGSGFPAGAGVGRIGLDISQHDGTTFLYALLDNYNRRDNEDEDDSEDLTKDQLRSMQKETFLALDEKKLDAFLKENRFPKKYDSKGILGMVKSGKIKPLALVEYLEDANSLLFDTPVIGAEVYISKDQGETWTKTHDDFLDRVYNSYGYYFGQIRAAPDNADKLYIMGVPILRSDDAGKNWANINKSNVHVDHHALWVNGNRPGHLILGNDGGINISYDDGENWIKCNMPAVGQYYAVAIDKAKPYNVYGGLQDNGVWVGPSNYEASDRWHSTGQYPYKSVLGGDGMQVQVDWRDNVTLYTGFQFGNYFRINKKSGIRKSISPKHELGDRPLRFNWQAPIHLSRHNQDILYLGSHKLHRSMDQGDSWSTISDDLTKGGKKGDVPFGTLATIHESSIQFGLIYTGSDDGLINVTKDGGVTWTQISDELPQDMWISRVQASKHEKSRVFVSLNGYRWDDFSALIYASDDYGKTWQKLGLNLPNEPVNDICEDPENPNLIYVATDHGLYISLDRGVSFMAMNKDLPKVPIHDILVHPDARELIVGTHGRSIHKADVSQLQQLDQKSMKEPLLVFDIGKSRYSSRWGSGFGYSEDYIEPEVFLPVYLGADSDIVITIQDETGTKLNKIEKNLKKGIHFIPYQLDLSEEKADTYEKKIQETEADFKFPDSDNGKKYLYKGTYSVVISVGDTSKTKNLIIE